MAVDQLFVHLEELDPLLFAVGEFLGFIVDSRLVVLLNHVRVQQRQGVLMLQHHRVVLLAELAFKGFARRHQLIPGFWVGDAGFFPGFIVKVEDAGGDGNGNAVELAVHGGGLQLLGVKLAEIDDVLHLIQVVEAVAIFRENRQPVPVGLHHVRLGAAGDLRGQARKVTVPAGVFRFDVNIRILLMKFFQRFQGHLMAAVAAPPGHAQVDILCQRR